VKKIKVPPNWEDRPDSFERFQKLAKGLMTVSKKELDKQIEKEERKKTRKRKRQAVA
jgi:hypothetical protein